METSSMPGPARRLRVLGVAAVAVVLVVGGLVWFASTRTAVVAGSSQSDAGRFAPDGWSYLVVKVHTASGEPASRSVVSGVAVVVRDRLDTGGVTDHRVRLRPGRAVIAIPPGADPATDLSATEPIEVAFRPVLATVPGDGCATGGYLCDPNGDIGYELDDPVLDAAGVSRAVVSPDPNVGPTVAISFTSAGQATFTSWTASNVGRQLAIVVGGIVASAPQIQGEITGDALISGAVDATEGDLELLAAQIDTAAAGATWMVEEIGLDPPRD